MKLWCTSIVLTEVTLDTEDKENFRGTSSKVHHRSIVQHKKDIGSSYVLIDKDDQQMSYLSLVDSTYRWKLDGNVLLVTMDDKRRNCGVILKLRNPELQLEFHCLTAFLETSLYDSLVSFMDPSAKKKKEKKYYLNATPLSPTGSPWKLSDKQLAAALKAKSSSSPSLQQSSTKRRTTTTSTPIPKLSNPFNYQPPLQLPSITSSTSVSTPTPIFKPFIETQSTLQSPSIEPSLPQTTQSLTPQQSVVRKRVVKVKKMISSDTNGTDSQPTNKKRPALQQLSANVKKNKKVKFDQQFV